MKKCIFCKSTLVKVKVNNFKIIKSSGYFYNCLSCKIDFNPKKYNEKIYTKKKNINFFGKKNFIYYLKSFFLIIFFLKIKKYLNKKKKINILDYGAGSGEFTNLLSSTKNNIYATDYLFNKHFYSDKVDFINIKNIFNKKNYKKFDVIILRHVLEHILDLSLILKKLKLISKNKQTVIIIEVPNYNSFWKIILKNRWPGYFYPYHHYVFSKKFLINVLKKNKLQIMKTNYVEPPMFGSYLYIFGLNRNLCKIISIFLYPFQYLFSKLNFKSEGLLLIVKND